MDQLRAGGRKVVLIEPIPFSESFDPLSCLSGSTVVEQCRYIDDASPTPEEQLYRELDRADTSTWSFDLDHLVCPYLPICDPIINGQVVKLDYDHLTASFSVTLAPAIDTFLSSNGIVTAAGGGR